MKMLTRLIVSSIATRSVFQRFAALSDEDKTAVVDKVKAKVNGDASTDDAAAEEVVDDSAEDTTSEEAPAEGDAGLEGIVDGISQEIETIKSDGQVTPGEVMGLMDNIMQMVDKLLGAKPARKSRAASREERIVERILTAAPSTAFEKG